MRSARYVVSFLSLANASFGIYSVEGLHISTRPKLIIVTSGQLNKLVWDTRVNTHTHTHTYAGHMRIEHLLTLLHECSLCNRATPVVTVYAPSFSRWIA